MDKRTQYLVNIVHKTGVKSSFLTYSPFRKLMEYEIETGLFKDNSYIEIINQDTNKDETQEFKEKLEDFRRKNGEVNKND